MILQQPKKVFTEEVILLLHRAAVDAILEEVNGAMPAGVREARRSDRFNHPHEELESLLRLRALSGYRLKAYK